MPKYQIDVPGQGTFEVDSPTDLSDHQAYQAVLGQINATPAIKPDTGATGAFKASKENILADFERLKGKTGFKDVNEAEAAAKAHEVKAGQVFKPTEESWTEAPFTKFKETLGGSLPYMAAPVAAGIGAAALPITGTAATVAGLGLTGLTSAAQFTGSNLSRKVKEGQSLEEASLLEAGAAAVPQAALDVIGLRMIPGIRGIFGKAGVEITEEQAAKLAQRSLLEKAGSVSLQTGKTMGAEGLTETGQQVLERLQAGLSITDPQARQEYYDSFIGGAVLGGALGTAGQAFESKKVVPNAPTPAPEAAQLPTGPTQPSLDLEGLQPTPGPQVQTPAQADPQRIAQIRDQYDTIEREMDRLKSLHDVEDSPEVKRRILEDAQKLDFARQELQGQLEGAPARPTAPEGQAALDFTQPYPKSRLQAEPPIIGQQAAVPAPQANLDLEFAKQRLAAGAPITPAQELLVRQDQAQQRVAQQTAPTPNIEIPNVIGAGARPMSHVVDDAVIKSFGFSKRADVIKNQLRGLNLMNPEDAAKFDDIIAKHDRKPGAKMDRQAVQDFVQAMPEPVAAREVPEKEGLPARPYDARKAYQQAREAQFAFGQKAAPLSPRDVRAQKKAEYDERTGVRPVSGRDERGVQLPSTGVPTTEGVAAPAPARVGSPVGVTEQPNAGAAPSGEVGNAALAQLAQQVAPATKEAIPQTQAKAVIPETVDETLARVGAPTEVSADTEELMRQLGIGKVQRPNLQGGTTQALQDKVFQGDIKGALKAITSDKTGQFTPLDKEVASRLLQSKSLPKIEVVDPSVIEDGAPAQYNPNTDTVQIARGQVDSHTVLHETVHGFMHVMITDSEAREAKGFQPNPMLNNLRAVYDAVKSNPALLDQYGLKNLSEFTSEAFSNPAFQAALSKIPYKRMNVFTAFGRAVLKALGIKVEGNVAQTDALTATLIAAEQIMSHGRNVQTAVGARANVGPVAAPKLERLTKLAEPNTVGKQVKDVIKEVNAADFRTSFVDAASALGKKLAPLARIDASGKLRADMLHRTFAQVNNVINNGLPSGVPVLNENGSVTIRETSDNLGRSNELAHKLNSNPYIKAQGMNGMEFVAEVARIERGREIMAEDSARRITAASMLQAAEKKRKDARKKGVTGAQAIKLNNEAKALEAKYKDDVALNRELEVTPEHLAWASDALKNVPQVKEILGIWRNINESLLDLREKAGLISKEHADELRKNVSYVPLFASEEDLEAMRDPNIAISGTGAKSVMQEHKLKGSELTRNIWENIYKQYAVTTAAVFQNQVRKVGISQLESLGGATTTKNAKDPKVNVRFRDVNHPDADSNGIVNAIVPDIDTLAAFQAMHYELGPIMKAMAASTKLLRAGALINPMYWVKQLIRDPLHASVVGKYVVTPVDSIAKYLEILKGGSETVKILKRHGVFGGVDSTTDMETFLKGIGTQKTVPTRKDKMLHAIMQMHEASDAATRVAIYDKAYADAISKGMSKEAAESYGVMQARESANFSVHGNSKSLNTMRNMIPFFSAAITSLDTVYRAATGFNLNPAEKAEAKRIFRTRALAMTMMTIAYAMAMQDDPDYQKLPDDVKDANWLMPNPLGEGHSFIKVPVPFEVGFLFKTVPEAAVRYLADNSTGKEVLGSYLSGVVQNLPGNGLPIPQAAKPILETMTNHSFFTGRTIESMSDQNVRVGLRGQNASETAKILSNLGLDKINLSPAKIDNIIQGYTAQLGTFGTNAVDVMINAAEGKTGANKNIEELPGFKTFMTNPNVSKAVGDFYKLQHEAVDAVTEFNRIKNSGDREGMMSFLEDERNKRLVMSEPALRKLGTQLTTIHNQAQMVKNNEKLDPEVRRERVNKLMDMYDKIAQQMNRVLAATKLEK
jgi:hypothetical protein